MLDFQQKRKVRSLMYHRATLVVLGVISAIFVHSTWTVFQKERESERLKNISLYQVEEMRQRNEELRGKISRLETEPGLEEEIRSKFSVAKEDERVVIILENEEPQATTTVHKRGFWTKIKDLFTKKE